MSVFAIPIQGKVSEQGSGYSNRIIDKATGDGVDGAKITLPKQKYSTKTDSDGYFELDTYVDGTSIMSVQKKNYKPFSMTVNDMTLSKPLVIGIEKSNADEMVLDSSMYHLGDGNCNYIWDPVNRVIVIKAINKIPKYSKLLLNV